MPWEPGQSGNPNGARREPKRFAAALERALAQDDGKRLRDCAEKLLDFASQGVPWAVQFLAERLDGRADQNVNVGVDITRAEGLSVFGQFMALAIGRTQDTNSEAVDTGGLVLPAEIRPTTQ